MALPRMAARKKRAPAQTGYLKPAPQARNGDVLDVAEAAILLRLDNQVFSACNFSIIDFKGGIHQRGHSVVSE
jgi:hypothetical protein